VHYVGAVTVECLVARMEATLELSRIAPGVNINERTSLGCFTLKTQTRYTEKDDKMNSFH